MIWGGNKMTGNKNSKMTKSLHTRKCASHETYEHRDIDEKLSMSRYHLQSFLSDLINKKYPKLDNIVTLFGLAITALISFLTSQFQKFMGIDAEIWKSIIFLIMIVACILTLVLFLWWTFNKIFKKEKTPLELVDDFIAQMEKDKKRIINHR